MEKRNFWMFEFFMSDPMDKQTRESHKNYTGYGPTLIDLNEIVGLEPPKLFKAEPDYSSHRQEDVVLATVYMSWSKGRGINGISNVFYISEKDYKEVAAMFNICVK